jgi:hypothetical protein
MKPCPTFLALVAIAAMLLPTTNTHGATVSALKTGDQIMIESKGGALTYKAVLSSKAGGDITQVSLPADGKIVARELNDIFYHGTHGDEYTLRGWTGKTKFIISCAMEVLAQKPEEVTVKVKVIAMGTFKILTKDEVRRVKLKQSLKSYRDKAVEIQRTYMFKPDRITVKDEVVWAHTDMEMTTVYFTAAFMPGCVQGPARLVRGATKAPFNVVPSGGGPIPPGITYPFVSENFLKNGYKVTLRTTEASFDFSKSEKYFYEKPWQQDWYQLSGFMYRPEPLPPRKPLTFVNEVMFSKADASEMPPVVTIQSPSWDARWLDETNEVPKYKIGDTIKLSASAVNLDGSRIPDKDISWEIHIDPWWKTPPVTLQGARVSYTLPEVANDEDRKTSENRNLLAVVKVKAKGKNDTEAVEPFAMLVGKNR